MQSDPTLRTDPRQEIVALLRRAYATACNDDLSKPGTRERFRHCERIEAIASAIDYLEGRNA